MRKGRRPGKRSISPHGQMSGATARLVKSTKTAQPARAGNTQLFKIVERRMAAPADCRTACLGRRPHAYQPRKHLPSACRSMPAARAAARIVIPPTHERSQASRGWRGYSSASAPAAGALPCCIGLLGLRSCAPSSPSESVTGQLPMNHAKIRLGIPLSQFIFGSVLGGFDRFF